MSGSNVSILEHVGVYCVHFKKCRGLMCPFQDMSGSILSICKTVGVYYVHLKKVSGSIVSNHRKCCTLICPPIFDIIIHNKNVKVRKEMMTFQLCVTSLVVNGEKMFVGQNGDQPSFWIDGDQQYCGQDYMSTTEITIQNGNIVSSECGN